jgi:hypothetical protein
MSDREARKQEALLKGVIEKLNVYLKTTKSQVELGNPRQTERAGLRACCV